MRLRGRLAHVAPLWFEQAWDELCLMHVRSTNTGPCKWATIHCDGTECADIEYDPGEYDGGPALVTHD